MKSIFGFLFFFFFSFSTGFSQEIPNPSFESWGTLAPIGWHGFNIIQTDSAYDGNYAVLLKVFDDNIEPILIAGEITPGITISERYGSFNGFFKFDMNGNDFLKIDVLVGSGEELLGIGSKQFYGTSANWQPFTVPIVYTAEGIPDAALIFIWITNENESPVPGSKATIDLVSFDFTTDIEQRSNHSAASVDLKNYPNPFDQSTTISFELAASSDVSLEVFNLSGQKVATLLKNEWMNSGHQEIRFDTSVLPSGLYFYTLSSGDFVMTKKMNCIK